MTRFSKPALLGLFVVTVVGMAADEEKGVTPSVDETLAPIMTARDAEAKIRRAMQKTMPNDLKSMPLKDLVASIGKMCEINVWLDEPTLTEEGLSANKPITARVGGLTVETALNRVLPNCHLTWLIDHEVLKITTERRAPVLVQRILRRECFAVNCGVHSCYRILQRLAMQNLGEDDARPQTAQNPTPKVLDRPRAVPAAQNGPIAIVGTVRCQG